MGRPLGIFFGRDDLAVAHVNDAVSVLGGFGIVRDHHDGLAEFFVGLAQHVEDNRGILGIEVAGRLVGENDGGTIDERTRQGDALLLASGELVGAMVETSGDAEQFGNLLQVCGIGSAEAGDVGSDVDVALSGKRGEKVEFLEDESYFAFAEAGALGVGKRGEIDAVDGDAAGVGAGKASEQVKERGLAAAGRADYGDELTLLHAERDAAQRGHVNLANAVSFAEFSSLDEGGHPIKTISHGEGESQAGWHLLSAAEDADK